MKKKLSITELKRMSLSELLRELKLKRTEAAKMRLGLVIQKEKDHASYRIQRRDIARLSMVIGDLQRQGVTVSETKGKEKKPSQKPKNERESSPKQRPRSPKTHPKR